MCGRYLHLEVHEEFIELFQLPELSAYAPRYNIAPSQTLLAIAKRDGAACWLQPTWGFVPHWAREPGPKSINAKAETIATSGAFRSAFQTHRCLILADGFYEWRREGSQKTPMWIRPTRGPIGFAGIWSGDDATPTCAVITVPANDQVRSIHDRMPAILDLESCQQWLDDSKKPSDLQALLRPFAEELLISAVRAKVNNARIDSAECLNPAPPPPRTLFDDL